MPWEWWAIGSLGLLCAWLVVDNLDVRQRLRGLPAAAKRTRKVKLIGGPMDDREIDLDGTAYEMRIPGGVYRTVEEMHYRDDGRVNQGAGVPPPSGILS